MYYFDFQTEDSILYFHRNWILLGVKASRCDEELVGSFVRKCGCKWKQNKSTRASGTERVRDILYKGIIGRCLSAGGRGSFKVRNESAGLREQDQGRQERTEREIQEGRRSWRNSGIWWWRGRPGMLRFMGLQRVRHDWATELNWTEGVLRRGIFKGYR